MSFEDFNHKKSVTLVYTGDGKGKTSASLGLAVRALGADWSVAYVQFIKHWQVSEHKFIEKIQKVYGDRLYFYKGGAGFYNAGDLSAKNITQKEHKELAEITYQKAYQAATSGKYNLVICDEINNAYHDGLLDQSKIEKLLDNRDKSTSLCLTGRNFPEALLKKIDIATDMKKIKHHFDDKFLANVGIDY